MSPEFPDNITAALPDVIAQTIFNAVAHGVTVPKRAVDTVPKPDEIVFNPYGLLPPTSEAVAVMAYYNSLVSPLDALLARLNSPDPLVRAQADWPRYRFFSDTVERLLAVDWAARKPPTTYEGEIVVTGKRMTDADKAAYDRKHGDGVSSIAAGGIGSRLFHPSAKWTPFFNDEGSQPGLPIYLRKNSLIGDPGKNLAFINQIKDLDGVWQIDWVILPSLAMHLDDPDVKTVHDELRNYVDDINARANAETNKWAGQLVLVAWGAPAAGAATAATGGLALAPIIEGGGALGLTAEGGIAFVSAGNAGLVNRYAMGDPISLGGYGEDGTIGLLTFGLFRGVGAYGDGWRPSFRLPGARPNVGSEFELSVLSGVKTLTTPSGRVIDIPEPVSLTSIEARGWYVTHDSAIPSYLNAAESKVLSPATNVVDGVRLRSQLMSQEIAGGHAFEKHVLGVGSPAGAEFGGLGIRTRNQFAEHLENVINNPTQSGALRGGREYFYDRTTNTLVIRNPRAPDGGTAFRPIDPTKTLNELR